MQTKSLVSLILTLSLAVFFGFYFQFTKHNPTISRILPFDEDPFDAVGSFGFLLAGFTSILAIYRFLKRESEKQKKAEVVVVLSVLVSIFVNFVAMARYLDVWYGKAGSLGLLLLTTGLLVLGFIASWQVQLLTIFKKLKSNFWWEIVAIGFFLYFYPTTLNKNFFGLIFTVLVSAGFLFLLIKDFLGEKYLRTKYLGWVVGLSLLVGLGLFVGEVFGESTDATKLTQVALLFVFIGGIGSIIGYLTLGNYLFE